jgi:hypothetical protein
MKTREQKEEILLALLTTVREHGENLTVGEFIAITAAMAVGHFAAVAEDASDPALLKEFSIAFIRKFAALADSNYNLLMAERKN